MSKVIFLDFDGVLLTDSAASQQINAGLTLQNYLQTVVFDEDCVANLNHVINTSGAALVLSTSWAFGHSFSSLAQCLMRNGVDPGHLWEYDDPSEGSYMTPRNFSDARTKEIRDWIEDHPEVTAWCAVDDRQDVGRLGPNAVITNPLVGLDTAAAAKMLQILAAHS